MSINKNNRNNRLLANPQRTLKKRSNWSSPLQGEIEGVGNIKDDKNHYGLNNISKRQECINKRIVCINIQLV